MNFKKIYFTILISTIIFQEADAQVVIKNQADSVSYSFGVSFGDYLKNVLKQQGVDPNPDLMIKGIEQVLKGQPSSIDPQKANAYIQSYIQNQKMVKADANKAIGEKFLAENKTKPGIITTASGLQYQVIKTGVGAKPLVTEKVKVHYHGTLIDGTVFDSSVERGTPAEFGVNQVIQGWIEALQMMTVGSKWKVFIPANLGYGVQGSGSIGPNAVLIFEIELIDIVK